MAPRSAGLDWPHKPLKMHWFMWVSFLVCCTVCCTWSGVHT